MKIVESHCWGFKVGTPIKASGELNENISYECFPKAICLLAPKNWHQQNVILILDFSIPSAPMAFFSLSAKRDGALVRNENKSKTHMSSDREKFPSKKSALGGLNFFSHHTVRSFSPAPTFLQPLHALVLEIPGIHWRALVSHCLSGTLRKTRNFTWSNSSAKALNRQPRVPDA